MMAVDGSEIEAYAQLIKFGFNLSPEILPMHWYSDSFSLPGCPGRDSAGFKPGLHKTLR